MHSIPKKKKNKKKTKLDEIKSQGTYLTMDKTVSHFTAIGHSANRKFLEKNIGCQCDHIKSLIIDKMKTLLPRKVSRETDA